MNITAIQNELLDRKISGWLLTDYQCSNLPALQLLGMDPGKHLSRRWLYLIPARGEPLKIVHAIEAGVLDHLPGDKVLYSGREPLIRILKAQLKSRPVVAMEYSPEARIPAISRVDAGTIELIRTCGAEVVSSADLMQRVTARWDDAALASHRAAAQLLRGTVDSVWRLIANRSPEKPVTEWDVQQHILTRIAEAGYVTEHSPICAIKHHSADPHFEVSPENALAIGDNDLVMIDLWAKPPEPGAIFADITWMAFTGTDVPGEVHAVFSTVVRARDTAVKAVRRAFSKQIPISGAELDRVCRGVITDAGYGKAFLHRTGHSLGESVHGPGANLDSVESVDDRIIIPRTGFTIEPGIYLADRFGVRSELNVTVDTYSTVDITGQPVQTELVLIQ